MLTAGVALAADPEPTFSYAGRINATNGKPLNGTYDVEIRFFGSEKDADQLGPMYLFNEVAFIDGIFQIPLKLSGADQNTIFGDYAAGVYIEVKQGGKVYPRQRFLATPYALRVPIDPKTLRYDDDAKLTVGPASAPGVNQFLTKDGSGDLVWATPAAGPAASIGGKAISAVPFNANEILLYDGTSWKGVDASTFGGGGGGTVTAVSGSGPVSVTNGTTTPQISVTQATSVSDGYLTSTDWLNFSGKQDALGYTPLDKAGDSMAAALGLAPLASDPAGLGVGDKGKVWFNSTSGEVKYWNGSAAVALGAAGSGLANLSGEIGNSQTLSIGSAGNTPAWVHASDDHTLNIPMANAGASVTAGLISNSDYVAFSAKLNKSGDAMSGPLALGANKITGVADPAAPQDAATKNYVDTGLAAKAGTSHTHPASDVSSGGVSNTEFDYLDGVTSAIQTQIDGKAPTAHSHGNAEIVAGVDAAKISAGSVSNAEFDYLDGVTAAIQTQINAKAASVHGHAASEISAGNVSNTEFDYLDGVTAAIQTQIDGKQAALGFSPLNKAGDVMSGTFGLASLAADPSGLVAGDKGKVWFNSTTGEVKYWNGSAAIALGAAGSGLGNLSGETGAAQTLSTGTAGNAPAWVHASNDHKFNIPMANAGGSVTAGLISNSDYVAFSGKLNKSGGTMTGDVDLGGHKLTNVGNIGMASDSTLAISANAVDPSGLTSLDAGKLWYNSTSGLIKYYDGLTTVTLGSAAVTSAEITDGTIVDDDVYWAAAIDTTKLAAGTVSNTEFGYLDGVTGAIQTQINGKAPSSHTHGNADIVAGVNAAKISAGNVSNTEFDYLNGVTGAIQTQINGKAATAHTHAATSIGSGNVDNTEFDYLDGVTSSIQTQFAGKAPTAHAHGNAEIIAGVDAAKISAGSVSNTEFDALDGVTSSIQTQLDGKQASLGYTPLNKAGDVMVGTFGLASLASDPAGLVAGDKGKVWFNSTSGEVKYWDGAAPIALGAAGSSIGDLSGETGAAQTLTTGTAGNAPAWVHASNDHKFNIPMANAGASVTAGLISNADYVAFGGKQAALGYTPLDKAGDTFGGNMDAGGFNLSNTGNISMGADKTLAIGAYTTDPTGLTAVDAGKVWFNGTSGQIKYYDGGATRVVGTSTVTSTEIANGTILDADVSASAAIDTSKLAAGTVSNTEFGYLDGATSSLQTQINGKAATSHSHGNADIVAGVDAAKISAGSVSNAEFDYLDGVTSAIQTQMNGKAATAHTHAATAIGSGNVDNIEFDYLNGVTSSIQTQFAGKAPTAHSHGNAEIIAGVDAAKISAGSVSNTEFDYLNGVTSAIQTQINGKSATSHTHAATAIGSGNVDNTEFDYLNGVTSAIQTQINGKAPTAHSHGDSEITAGVNATKIGGGTVDNTEFSYLNGVTSSVQTQLGTKLPLAGGTMTGAVNHGGYDVTNVGNLAIAAGKTVQLGTMASDPGSLVAGDAGKVWVNTTAGRLKYWSGSAYQTVGTVGSVDITPPAAGIDVSGGPITSSGSLTLSLADDLAAVEGIATTGAVERTGTNTWGTYTVSAFGKTLVDDATNTAARTTLGLGTLATLSTVGSTEITNSSIMDVDINGSAAIADTKLATIATAGKVSGTAITSGIINSTSNIYTSGSVGIGTTVPGSYKLAVSGPVSGSMSYSSYTADGLFGATALPSRFRTPATNEIRFGYKDDGAGSYVPRLGFYQATNGNVTGANASIGLEINGKLSIGAGAANATAVTVDTVGNVGIGTTSPGAKLAIKDSVAAGTAIVDAIVIDPDATGVDGGNGSSLGSITWALPGSSGVPAARINAVADRLTSGGGDNSAHLEFWTNTDPSATEKMRISANGSVGIGTTAPASTAALEVASTTKGFLPPRLTTAQRDAMSGVTAGMVVFNTTSQALNVYTSTGWIVAGGAPDVIHIVDQKSQGIDGGPITSGSWFTRTLNTTLVDSGSNLVSLSASQFTLKPGTYECDIQVPGRAVNEHMARLYDVTNSTVVKRSPTGSSSVAVDWLAFTAQFTITANTTYKVQHITTANQAVDGAGKAANISTEVERYTDVYCRKF